MRPLIQPATPTMAPVASELIYLTMGKLADYLFGADSAQNVLQLLFRARSNRFSYQFTQVTTLSGEVTGLVVAYSGRVMKALELPMAWHLLHAGGIVEFARFITRALPLFSVTEAEDDQYFISNIAVLPAHQRQGMGQQLLAHAEQTARAQGFGQIALTVDVENEQAQSLYLRSGYRVTETVEIKPLAQRIGYGGYHRMVRILT